MLRINDMLGALEFVFYILLQMVLDSSLIPVSDEEYATYILAKLIISETKTQIFWPLSKKVSIF